MSDRQTIFILKILASVLALANIAAWSAILNQLLESLPQ